MPSRPFVPVLAVVAILIAATGGLLAYDSSARGTIPDGVSAGGVELGGLSASQARARLHAHYHELLSRTVVLSYGERRFELTARAARVSFDVEGTVQAALDESRRQGFVTRVWRSLTGGRVDAALAPKMRFSRRAVARLVDRVRAAIDRPAQDATVAFSGSSLSRVPSRRGLAVRNRRLTRSIEAALTDAGAPRELRIPVRATDPKVTSASLAFRYPTVITIDRGGFTLRLWKSLKLARSYSIAVGRAGLETPAGLYHIADKEVDPSWHVPNSAWAGALAGTTVPPGPQDPIKARWLGIYNGAGIHGTDELGSLGSAASHGCIRMAIPDVIELYSRTPLGTPVYIA
jgi:hypothetical protein